MTRVERGKEVDHLSLEPRGELMRWIRLKRSRRLRGIRVLTRALLLVNVPLLRMYDQRSDSRTEFLRV